MNKQEAIEKANKLKIHELMIMQALMAGDTQLGFDIDYIRYFTGLESWEYCSSLDSLIAVGLVERGNLVGVPPSKKFEPEYFGSRCRPNQDFAQAIGQDIFEDEE